MIITVRGFVEAQELDDIQTKFGFSGGPEDVFAALAAPWTRARRSAHIAIFGGSMEHLSDDFVKSCKPPITIDAVQALAAEQEFDLLSTIRQPLRDWYWWGVMLLALSEGHTRRNREAIEATALYRLETRMSKDAWLGANDRKRDRHRVE